MQVQVLLVEPRYRRLEAAARRRRVSVATIDREAIEHDLDVLALGRHAAGQRFLEAPSR